MQLSVIIVSYNVKYFLEQCLYSVLAACKNLQAEIIVIDNASEDDSLSYLKPKFAQVNFIENKINTGFAKANNKALSIANGKFILYLNPDTIIAEETITNCISFFEKNDKAGATGIKMIDGSGNFLPESKRTFPSVMASFWKLSGMAFLFPRSSLFNRYATGNLDENKTHEIEVLAGAFFLSVKNILLSLNGFDEDFFMYGEDIDLSFRITNAGYKNYYIGSNIIIHFKGESTKKNKVYVNNFYGAMKLFVNKHYKKTSAVLLKPAITAGAIIASSVEKINRVFSPSKKENTAAQFILAGDKEATASAAAILTINHYSFQYLILPDDRNAIPESFITNNELLKHQPFKHNLVFCLNKLTYSNSIQFVHNNKNKFLYYWHYKGSESIVSGSKAAAITKIYIAR